MAYDFKDKTAQEITDTLNAIVDNKNSTPADVDAAFDALKTATPEAQRRAVDDFEDDLIGKTGLTAVYPDDDYNTYHDAYYGDKHLATPAAARAISRVYAIKGGDAQQGIAAFGDSFNDDPPESDKDIPDFFSTTIEGILEGIGESDTLEPADTTPELDLIRNLVDHPNFDSPAGTGAKEAIRRLQAADAYTRTRLIDKLAKIETAEIKEFAADPKKQPRNAGVFNRFARYIAEAKGDAASPELKAYAAAHPPKEYKHATKFHNDAAPKPRS